MATFGGCGGFFLVFFYTTVSHHAALSVPYLSVNLPAGLNITPYDAFRAQYMHEL